MSRNPIAKDLRTPKYRTRVVPAKVIKHEPQVEDFHECDVCGGKEMVLVEFEIEGELEWADCPRCRP